MDVILHFGLHRTATTTFQVFLSRNARALGDAGVAIWTPDRTRAGLFAGLMQPSGARPGTQTGAEQHRAQRSAGLIAVELALLERRGVRTLIVSEENMAGALRANLREAALYSDIAARAARFRDAFGGRVTQVALSVRGYDAWWASTLAFGVAQGLPMPQPGLMNRLAAGPRGWQAVIADLGQVFAGVPLTVWPFERLGTRPEAQLTAMTHLHLPQATGLRDWLNPGPRRDKLRLILRLRGEADLAATLPAGDGRWMPFTPDQQAVLRARYQADMAWLGTDRADLARIAPAMQKPVGAGIDLGEGWPQADLPDPTLPDLGQSHDRERQMV